MGKRGVRIMEILFRNKTLFMKCFGEIKCYVEPN